MANVYQPRQVIECDLMLRRVVPASTGMSTAPEVVVARHCGLRVLGLSLITNMVVTEYESKQKANHDEVLETTRLRSKVLQSLVTKIVAKIE